MKRNSIELILPPLLMGCGKLTPPSILPQEVNVISQALQNWYIFVALEYHPTRLLMRMVR